MLAHRVGMYAWGGPATIRLLQTKYFSPRIDTESFLQLYDLPFLQRSKDVFGVTDMWITLSWGFSDATEKEDRRFILKKLPNFRKTGIRTHAYIQGFNLVTSEFPDQSVFSVARDGGPVPYSKGRSFTCPNNPAAQKIILDRVRWAANQPFNGIFIDNILFGLPPSLIRPDFAIFADCFCRHCQETFEKNFQYTLPSIATTEQEVRDLITFRTQSTIQILTKAAEIAHAHKKEFGVNFYDPLLHTPEINYGYSLEKLSALVDYILIENHGFPERHRGNTYLQAFIQQTSKPIFVVSYKKGIGFDAQYSAADYQTLLKESAALGFLPCLKATEFLTNGTWHALHFEAMRKVAEVSFASSQRPFLQVRVLTKATRLEKMIAPLLARMMLTSARLYASSRWVHALADFMELPSKVVRRPRLVSWETLRS